jgi:Domain of unknown function (DUF6468)
MNPSFGMAIETLVAILLVVTIGYCMLLNARLKRLKADEHSLKAVIGELVTATEIAERAIGGLKLAVRDVNENLGNEIASATQLSEHLRTQLAEGDHIVRRLTKIAIAARPDAALDPASAAAADPMPEPAPKPITIKPTTTKPSTAKAVAAAAEAFSERRRSGGLAA